MNELGQRAFRGISLFILPSLVGLLLFMFPVRIQGDITIIVAFLAKSVEAFLTDWIPPLMTGIIVLTILGTLVAKWIKPGFIQNNTFLKSLFDVQPLWVVTRLLGAVLAVATLFELGPEWIWSEDTGGLLLYDLIPLLFSVFLFAGLFLPLLLNFGLLEFFGTLLNRLMRPIFTLPGRSSIDCLASWMGDGTIGVLLTNKQYEEGFYTKREAAVIGTTFSFVSITFAIVVLAQLELEQYVLPYFLAILVAGIVAAIIMPRIPPLSRKADTYYEKAERQQETDLNQHGSIFKLAFARAVQRAQNSESFTRIAQGGVKNVLDMWMGVIPVVMAFGTLAVIIAEYTPVFAILGAPFVPILSAFQIPEASVAAQTMVVGFADMFLPAILGGAIESEMTRFVIACISVTQLIYMSEVGGLLLASKLPVRFLDLVFIFLLRTIITLPVIVFIAHLVF